MSKIASGELTEAGEVRSVSTEDNWGYHSENNRGKPKIHSVSVGTNTFVKLHRQKKIHSLIFSFQINTKPISGKLEHAE